MELHVWGGGGHHLDVHSLQVQNFYRYRFVEWNAFRMPHLREKNFGFEATTSGAPWLCIRVRWFREGGSLLDALGTP